MRKNNTAIIFGSLFFSCSVMAANGTLAPTVVPMVNGGQASIAISNTSPNLFTVPGDRIIAVNSLDGAGMPGNSVTERSRQLRHCQTERTGDCRLQHETDRGCVF